MARRHTTNTTGLVIAGLLILSMALGSPQPVHADAAPPQAPPGSSITNDGFETNVQMVSEEVIIDIGYFSGPEVVLYEDGDKIDPQLPWVPPWAFLNQGDLYAHVSATFFMQNQGSDKESFDVWYPIGSTDGYFEVTTVANFEALVDGLPVEVGQERIEEHDLSIPWATWPVTFLPGEVVELTVEYDMAPTYYGSARYFDYILETGADWWGTIGEGSFLYQLPYDMFAENARSDSLYSFSEDGYTVSDNTLRWTFTNLEPTRENNLTLRILDPEIWERIQTARAEVAANPDSPEALLGLVEVLEEAQVVKHGIAIGNQLSPQIVDAHKRLIEVDPDNIEYRIGYIEFLLLLSNPVGPLHEDLWPAIEDALALAPTDQRLRRLRSEIWAFERRLKSSEDTPTPAFTMTPTTQPTLTPTKLPMPTLVPSTPTPEPTMPLDPAEATPILPLALLGLTALLVVGALARRPPLP